MGSRSDMALHCNTMLSRKIARFDGYRTALQPFVVDAVSLIESTQGSAETNFLAEGANALMLDLDHGLRPPCLSHSRYCQMFEKIPELQS